MHMEKIIYISRGELCEGEEDDDYDGEIEEIGQEVWTNFCDTFCLGYWVVSLIKIIYNGKFGSTGWPVFLKLVCGNNVNY